jgi:DNA-binding MurR/RpiR family transcriptional regulator
VARQKKNGAIAPSDVHRDGPASARPLDDIILTIRQSTPDLRPAEKRVAETVLADVHFAVHASNGDLARRAGVSEPTVTRFSRAVGCGGVRELKVKLAQSMVVGRIYLEPPPHVGSEQARPALWQSVFEEIRRALTAVEQQLDQEQVDRAAQAIAACKRLIAFGVGGGSTIAAEEVKHRFFRLGVATANYSDPQLMRMIAATLGPDDVVLAVSTAGRAAEVIDAVTIARQYGAQVVAVTRPMSRLAELADVPLLLHVPEAPNALKPTASRYALLAAIDLLAASTAYRMPREAQEQMRRIKYALVNAAHGDIGDPLGD